MHKLGWGWPATALCLAFVVGVAGLFLLARPEDVDLAGAAAATSLVVHSGVLVAAAFVYLHWRLSGSTVAGWLTLTLGMLSVPHLALAGVLIADPAAADRGPWWPLVTKAAVAAVLFLLVGLAGRFDAPPGGSLPFDPLAAGLAAGLGFSALGLALIRWAPDLVVPSALITALSLVPVLLALGIAWLSSRGLAGRGRLELTLGVTLLAVGGVPDLSGLPDAQARGVSLLASIVGAALLGHLALDMLRTSIRLHRKTSALLYNQLVAVESASRESRARLHEVASTLAGISSVSRLVHEHSAALPWQRRSLLEHTMDAELERLQRLIQDERDDPCVFAVDDVVHQLVLAQRAQGRPVDWEPTGLTVRGQPDHLTEALHILLDNAANHGQNAGATVDARQLDGVVEIAVSDRGPGIAPDVRPHIFEWGRRGGGSSGQGIGLSIARDLVEQQGGYLLLDDSPQPGTTFVLGVLEGERDDAVSHRAG